MIMFSRCRSGYKEGVKKKKNVDAAFLKKKKKKLKLLKRLFLIKITNPR